MSASVLDPTPTAVRSSHDDLYRYCGVLAVCDCIEPLCTPQADGELHYDESPVLGTSLADLSMRAFVTYHERQFGFPWAT